MSEAKKVNNVKKVYDSSLYKVTLWIDAVETWEEYSLPHVMRRHDGSLDTVAASEDWSYFVDSMHRDGDISDWQNHNWSCPPSIEA